MPATLSILILFLILAVAAFVTNSSPADFIPHQITSIP